MIISLQCEGDDTKWRIAAHDTNLKDSQAVYEILIEPAQGETWCLGRREVLLHAVSRAGYIFTALWKAFEEQLSLKCGLADLVQLCGYYQYTPKINARLVFAGKEPSECWWRAVQCVVSRIGVAKQLDTKYLAFLWEMPEESVSGCLVKLRQLGYEVRNHHTNPQIPAGQFLIPYSFPTLNPKSVQLHKSLNL